MTPLSLFVQTVIRASLISAVQPLVSHGVVDAKTVGDAATQAAGYGWIALASLAGGVALVWSHYRNIALLDLKARLDTFLGSTPAIPSSPSIPAVQSTVLPTAGVNQTK